MASHVIIRYTREQDDGRQSERRKMRVLQSIMSNGIYLCMVLKVLAWLRVIYPTEAVEPEVTFFFFF